MEVKLFEVRAPATLIIIMAIKLTANNTNSASLLCHSGYGRTIKEFENYIMVVPVDGGHGFATTDPYEQIIYEIKVAHLYIKDHFDELDNGSVIDTEFICGKSDKSKKSDLYPFYNDFIDFHKENLWMIENG